MKRLGASLRIALLSGVAVLLIGLADHFSSWPMLTSTLGPTAYLLFIHPGQKMSSLRNAAAGHGIGIAAGAAGLWLTGSWRISNAFLFHASSLPHVFAAAIAVSLTLFVMHALRVDHAPAGATALLVATGLAGPGQLMAGLALGLIALFLLQLALNRIPAPRS